MIKQLGVELFIDSMRTELLSSDELGNLNVLKELCRPKPWVDKLVFVDSGDEADVPTGIYRVRNITEIFEQ